MDKEAAYFFRYAFPCSGELAKLRRITQEEYEHLESEFKRGIAPSRKLLEDSFTKAFERIDRLAESMGKSRWDLDVLVKYWREDHNRIIDAGEGIYGKGLLDFNDRCKVHVAKVEKIEDPFLRVSYSGDKSRNVFYTLIPEVKIGDKVTIHHFEAVEIIN